MRPTRQAQSTTSQEGRGRRWDWGGQRSALQISLIKGTCLLASVPSARTSAALRTPQPPTQMGTATQNSTMVLRGLEKYTLPCLTAARTPTCPAVVKQNVTVRCEHPCGSADFSRTTRTHKASMQVSVCKSKASSFKLLRTEPVFQAQFCSLSFLKDITHRWN